MKGTGVEYLYIVDNQLQVLTVPEKLIWLDVSNGNIVQEYSKGVTALIQTELEFFAFDYGLKLSSPHTGKTTWHTKFDQSVNMRPVFSPNVIFLRTGRVIGSVYAIDRKSGKIIWQTPNNIISNIAYSDARQNVYVLSHAGNLLSINQVSGQSTVLAEFSSAPFILNGEQDVGGYEIAYDNSLEMLFLILGDSRQLFAFQEY